MAIMPFFSSVTAKAVLFPSDQKQIVGVGVGLKSAGFCVFWVICLVIRWGYSLSGLIGLNTEIIVDYLWKVRNKDSIRLSFLTVVVLWGLSFSATTT